MMTSARPIAMSKSRVQTRISLRSVFAEDAAPLAAPADAFAKSGEDRRESGFSGEVTEPRCFWSERSEEHTSELQSRFDLVCRLLLEKKKKVVYRMIPNPLCPWKDSPNTNQNILLYAIMLFIKLFYSALSVPLRLRSRCLTLHILVLS